MATAGGWALYARHLHFYSMDLNLNCPKTIQLISVICVGIALLALTQIVNGASPSQNISSVKQNSFFKNPGEDDIDFINRNTPKVRPPKPKKSPDDPDTTVYGIPELVTDPIISKWNSAQVLIVYYEISVIESRIMKTYVDHSKGKIVDAYIYVLNDTTKLYHQIFIGSFSPDGGEPEIASVFFANADKDTPKELVVLVKWEQLLHVDYSGTTYGAFFYDDLASVKGDSLVFLPNTTKRMGLSYDWQYRSGEEAGKNIYQTAGEVKRRLKKLGY